MTGAVVHANVIDQVLASRYRREATRLEALVLLAAMALVGALAFVELPVRWAVPVVAIAAAALALGTQWVFRRGVWLPAATPLLGLALAAVGGLAHDTSSRAARSVR